MKEIILAIDIGHNVPYDTGAVGIRREDDLNRLVGNALISKLRERGIKVAERIFQAEMLVRINNDGPVTILLDSKKTF